MQKIAVFPRFLAAALLLALFLPAFAGCSKENEPEERRAFITFLTENITARKGVTLPEISRKEEKSFGKYAGHYALLASFQKDLARETGKNAGELLALTAFEDLEAVSKAGSSLKKAAKEADTLRKIVEDLRAKADKEKAKLPLPGDLAPVYNAAYDKVVSQPAAASANMFSSVREAFAAILDLLDFIDTHSRDMEIQGRNINLKNIGLKDELDAKMAAVREKALELGEAYAEMMRTMLQ
ncbi:putative Lipoprotein [uncultured delta proteobacterium]|uniref:Putative Lipoprotein n=1 Tax=uncultured delta proteobacterium TaxID=34034 RepID=A0A212K1P9_9DELT|nr:putative Lipoprotein [uncultured delta proteobacterium]